jgi:ribosomal protein S18 acetylase RimI-like enzyme
VIKEVHEKDIIECVNVIIESFKTVAEEFCFTIENAPGFTAFSTTEEKIKKQLIEEHRPMYAFFDQGTIVGYYSLLLQEKNECELNNLCVLPTYRHKKVGEELIQRELKTLTNEKITSIVEQNLNKIEQGERDFRF